MAVFIIAANVLRICAVRRNETLNYKQMLTAYCTYTLLADSKNYGHDRLDKSNRQRRSNQID